MNDKDISATTDVGTLRLKRGVRKRNVGKIEAYLSTLDGLPLEKLKKSEIRWQLELLDQHSEFYELIQDRILELLEKTDHENHLEYEEQEAEDQRAFHRELRDRLEAALHSIEAYAMSKGIR